MSDHENPLAVEIRRGSPTAEELAAIVAVVSEAYATERATETTDDAPASTAWQRSARALRGPLRRGSVWGRFEG